MKCELTVYYTDGSSAIVEFEKPPGAHPTSPKAISECVKEAEFTGKTASIVCKTYYVGNVLVDDELWRLEK